MTESRGVELSSGCDNCYHLYALSTNDEGKVEKTHKLWNAPWAVKELGCVWRIWLAPD